MIYDDASFLSYAKEDRWWHRRLRIRRARKELALSTSDRAKDFWIRVLELNGVEDVEGS